MRFVEQAIVRAGLGAVLEARRAGDIDKVRASTDAWKDADLLVLGAAADLVRSEEIGAAVVIHRPGGGDGVTWIDGQGSDLDVLRAVAVARLCGASGARIGVDWTRHGLELAQVALGFGASDLRGAITRKSGLPILEDESKKVKGQGNVPLSEIKNAEIVALVRHAGRVPTEPSALREQASAHV
jgi:hypothetical protein